MSLLIRAISGTLNIYMNVGNKECHLFPSRNINRSNKKQLQRTGSIVALILAMTKRTKNDFVLAILPLVWSVWSVRTWMVCWSAFRWVDFSAWPSHLFQLASSAHIAVHPLMSCHTIHRSRQKPVCDPIAGCPLYTKTIENINNNRKYYFFYVSIQIYVQN